MLIMNKKYSIFLLVLAIFSYTSIADNQFIDDCLNPGAVPTVLYDMEISKEGNFLQYQEESIRIPKTGFSPAPITCISVINLLSNINGGFPYIKGGGIGFTYVNLYFKSKLSKGFDFQATVYYDAPVTTTSSQSTTSTAIGK